MSKLLRFWNHAIGRACILVLIAISIAAALKAYKDQAFVSEEHKREAINVRLIALHKKMHTRYNNAPNKAQFIKNLPTYTSWYPEHMPCGGLDILEPKAQGFWNTIITTHPAPKLLNHQIRLHHDKKGLLTWIARRDTDCDGLFETHSLAADIAYPSGSYGIHNRDE